MKRHPITKLSWAVQRRVSGEPDSIDCFGIERDIARHVKPLLDELERGIRIYYPAGPNQRRASDLLAEWRAKL